MRVKDLGRGDKCFCLPTGVIKPDEVLHVLFPPFYSKMILIISHTQLSGINFMIVLVIRIAFPGKQGKKLSATLLVE